MNKLYSLGFLLGRTSFALTKIFQKHFEENNIDLSSIEFILLRSLSEDGNMTQKEILEFIPELNVNIDQILTNLRDRKFIEENDYQISITSEGQAIISIAIDCVDGIADKVLSTVDEQDLTLLAELLDEIYTSANNLK